MRTAIYVRRALASGDKAKPSLGKEVNDLIAFAYWDGMPIYRIFEERKVSKVKGKRPQFEALLREIRSGRIDSVLVRTIDGLTRNEAGRKEITHLLRSGKLRFVRTPKRLYRTAEAASPMPALMS